MQRDGTFSIATSENFFGIYSVDGVLRHGKRAMPAPICTNIHRKNELTNNRQLLLADGFSFYAVAEISTTYDIALKGCGAYGFPLAAYAKETGHQARSSWSLATSFWNKGR